MKSVVVEMFNEILYPPQADEEEPDLVIIDEEVDAVEEPPLEVVQTPHPLPSLPVKMYSQVLLPQEES